jgi:prepilin-type N-terminal cleavage/methylation domain-containing protein
MNDPRRNRKGFTLVEMLAVILIIGILVAVVVAVANRLMTKSDEEQTRLWMQIIMRAVDVYHEEYGEYPDPTGNNDQERSASLYVKLWNFEAARKRLTSLPSDAVQSGGSRYFLDGFGQALRYHAHGMGGTPYLESAGGDWNFGSAENLKAKEDNIRSDRL